MIMAHPGSDIYISWIFMVLWSLWNDFKNVGVPLLFSFLLQTYCLAAPNILRLVPWWVSHQYPQLVENNCQCSHSCLKVF